MITHCSSSVLLLIPKYWADWSFELGRLVLVQDFWSELSGPSCLYKHNKMSISIYIYIYSFFPQTIRDWNDLPESLISSSELSDDSVSKFTSLVRARD